MPVKPDGTWESWATRNAREKAAAEAVVLTPTEGAAEEEAPKVTPKRQRRGKAAAKAAILEATNVEVDLDALDPEDI